MKRLTSLLTAIALLASSQLNAQTLTEWVENKGPSPINKIALGYPVPIPVDTPLPFDGFRTYAGLRLRHLDLAATTSLVHPENIGQTRSGRTIWAYRLGDEDHLTIEGLPEPATLTNGGIHAREWQTPEVVTGIMELLALHPDDNHLYDYLRDNVNMIVIPSLNVDGFLQTQRYPTLNFLQSDPDDPGYSPRDGRMRRKNMLSADEDLGSIGDHLNGVDLNRNNDPYWATNPGRSSPNLQSIVHHGAGPASEPEILALDRAAQLGPIDRLRVYTDVHSFSLVNFWVRNNNSRLASQTEKVLDLFTDHHREFPAGKWYQFAGRNSVPQNQGIGSTDEYFTYTYQVPSWTLEVEPSGGQNFHAPLPGGGADYGGIGENGHDGFILPDSQIRRVREQLAQSFAAVYYRQAGPPIIKAMRVIDTLTGAVIFDSEWDTQDSQNRTLYTNQIQALQIDHSYDMLLTFNKPMRWREDGEVVPFPGQHGVTLNYHSSIRIDDTELNVVVDQANWLEQPNGAADGYKYYQDDTLKLSFILPDDATNRDLISGQVPATLRFLTWDMTGMITDAIPATVVNWKDGFWEKYENSSGLESDNGGFDSTLSFNVTDQEEPPPFILEPGISASWYDLSRNGEGFLIEILADGVAVMYWYTYNKDGTQEWYVAVGHVRGNQIEFPELYNVTGGEFGAGFDPDKIVRKVVGSASFIWSDCDNGEMSYTIGTESGRMQLSRITTLMGLDCGRPRLQPISEEALYSGSWFDLSHDGEGFNIEVLADGRVVVYWFSFDKAGNRRWFFGVGEIVDGKLVFDNMMTTIGGIFGPAFDPDLVDLKPWGTLVLDINCHKGTATYTSSEADFGSGTLQIIRLTSIDGLECP